MGSGFEKGRKAGESSSASSSSSAEERRPAAVLGLVLGAGNRGRRVNARLWARAGGSDDEEDDGEDDLAFGEGERGAISPCWWRSDIGSARGSASRERLDRLDAGTVVCLCPCVTALVEVVREYGKASAGQMIATSRVAAGAYP